MVGRKINRAPPNNFGGSTPKSPGQRGFAPWTPPIGLFISYMGVDESVKRVDESA